MELLAIPFIALFVGWLYGRNQIDPNTPEGKAYYE
jgi:hypothetical protein